MYQVSNQMSKSISVSLLGSNDDGLEDVRRPVVRVPSFNVIRQDVPLDTGDAEEDLVEPMVVGASLVGVRSGWSGGGRELGTQGRVGVVSSITCIPEVVEFAVEAQGLDVPAFAVGMWHETIIALIFQPHVVFAKIAGLNFLS